MNKNNIISIFTLLTLLFCGVNSVISQEWESVYYSDGSEFKSFYHEAIELSNGNIFVSSLHSPRRNTSENDGRDFFSNHPFMSLISSEGNEISSNYHDYFKPGLCSTTPPYLFENNGEMYFLTSYSPDHDINSENYFKNFDNPPTESIIGLYKLDETLNVAESYEHVYPIDTSESRTVDWYAYLNYYCGYIYIYSAFEDDGHITGSYVKNESAFPGQTRQDSVFFFKMDFEGNFILRKGFEIPAPCGYSVNACFRQQMVKSDNGYIIYYRGCEPETNGTVEYYDNDFNYIATRYIIMPNPGVIFQNRLDAHCVMRSNHNTTYVATDSQSYIEESVNDDIRLYEFDDDLNNSTEVLPILNYIERRTPDHDRSAGKSIDITKNGDIYFTYSLNCGISDNNDSWIMVERLDSDFDTIATFFYNDVGRYNRSSCISTTKDDGLILVSYSYKINEFNKRLSKITKFPASAFVGIEEAHAHGLHLAVAYPNPGGDVMNIRTGLRNAVLTVYDLQGRKIHEQEITDDVTSVDASGWQSGTYVWKLGIRNEELGIKEVEEGKWVKL